MADALATCYEARTCFGNPQGRSMVGARMTLAALALAELCAKTVSDHGMRAAEAARRGAVDTSLEHIVEANTLLSGLGFESAGLAAAHAMAAGFTVIPALHQNWLHGELVGVGLVAHLVLEGDPAEAAHVARLLAGLGLPVRLSQIGIDPARDREALMQCMAAAVQEPFARNEPFEVTPERLFEAVCGADRISREALS